MTYSDLDPRADAPNLDRVWEKFLPITFFLCFILGENQTFLINPYQPLTRNR